MNDATLRVPAIHCDACVRRIVGAVEQVPGVTDASGDAEARTITVGYDADRQTLSRIHRAIEASGFEVTSLVTDADEAPVDAERPADVGAHRPGVMRVGIAAVIAGGALAVGGYLAGFLGYAYGIAVPGAFDQFSVAVVAVVSGIAAFFSPCVFPLLPGYVAYRAGASGRGPNRRSLATATAAAAGLTLANLALGAVIAALGTAAPFQPDPRQDIPALLAVRFLAGAAVIGLGLAALRGRSLAPAIVSLAARVAGGRAPGRGATETFLFGATYNAAGIGCTGPILLALLVYAIASGQALLAFTLFALTMGGLMFAVTLAAGLLGTIGTGRLAAASEWLERVGAIILIVAGTYTMISLSLATGRDLFVRTFLPFLP
jgi:cytochrome c-type biogenesis protein